MQFGKDDRTTTRLTHGNADHAGNAGNLTPEPACSMQELKKCVDPLM